MRIMNVESASVPACGRCDLRMCQFFGWNCRCGYYFDNCGCCPICYKCPGERCSFVAMERCMPGTRCFGPQDGSSIVIYNMGGQCLG